MSWNPDQYHKFQSERSAPFDDLLKLVDVRPRLKAVDLGCGTGELTRRLADALTNSNRPSEACGALTEFNKRYVTMATADMKLQAKSLKAKAKCP